MTKKELERPIGYYWIQIRNPEQYGDSTLCHIPLYFNKDNKWKVLINNDIQFISSTALKAIYGKVSILRAVDFDKDTLDLNSVEDKLIFEPAMMRDSKEPVTIWTNKFSVLIDNVVFPRQTFPIKDVKALRFIK